jgi:Tfp pilus assembly protein PilF
VPPEERIAVAGPLLSDPLRAVRAEAGRLLIGLAPEALGPYAAAARAALAEHEEIQLALAERAEARLNRAQLLAETGRAAEAEAELRAALRLDPSFVPAWVNLAAVARTTKGESEAEGVLRDGLGTVQHGTAALHHALGLTLVRSGRRAEALAELARAAELAPEEPRFGYVHAVALHDAGDTAGARAALEGVLARHPWHPESRFALAGWREAAGDAAGARRTLAELAAINPHDPGLAPAPPPGVDPRTPAR